MTADSPFAPLDGGCRCGQARFRMEAAPIITHSCHCHLCQRVAGTPFRTNAMIETAHLTLLSGQTRIYQGAKSHKQIQCADCGCTLWSHRPDLGDGIAFVGVGMLDQGERLAPQAHFFTNSKHPWITLPPGVPAFEELGDPHSPGARERIMAVLAATGMMPSMEARSGEASTA